MFNVYLLPLWVHEDLENLDVRLVHGLCLLTNPQVRVVHVLLKVQQNLLDLEDPEAHTVL